MRATIALGFGDMITDQEMTMIVNFEYGGRSNLL